MADSNFSKILFNENYDDQERVFLNVNLLRGLNNHLKAQLSTQELGSINCYNLESYLIEKAFDPNIREHYKSKFIFI